MTQITKQSKGKKEKIQGAKSKSREESGTLMKTKIQENQKMFYIMIKWFWNQENNVPLQKMKAENGKMQIQRDKILDRQKQCFKEILTIDNKTEIQNAYNNIKVQESESEIEDGNITTAELKEAMIKIKTR